MIQELMRKFFQNNGYLRGLIYFGLPALTVLVGAFDKWAETPPKNAYEIMSVIGTALVTSTVALRGFLDNHLSRIKEEKKEPQPPTP